MTLLDRRNQIYSIMYILRSDFKRAVRSPNDLNILATAKTRMSEEGMIGGKPRRPSFGPSQAFLFTNSEIICLLTTHIQLLFLPVVLRL